MRSKILILLMLLTALMCGAEEKKREELIAIRVVGYARSDASKKENRLLVVGPIAYRSVEELTKSLEAVASRPVVHFVIYGTCTDFTPRLTSEEIAETRRVCVKVGMRFTYYPAG